jgi:hypothetical protein
VPLSEHEQRVLRQIERQFQAETGQAVTRHAATRYAQARHSVTGHPVTGHGVTGQAGTRWSRPAEILRHPEEDARSLKRSALGFVLGLVALLVSFASSWVVGVVGFVAMVLCAVRFVQAARRLLMAYLERLATGVAPSRPPVLAPAPTLLAQLRRALWGDRGPMPAPARHYEGELTSDEQDDGPDRTWEA